MAEETMEAALRREIYLRQLKCSFCGKPGNEVETIVCGPTTDVAICNECVDLVGDIMREEREGATPEG